MSQPISRRGFVLGAGAATAAILTTRRGLSSPATEQRVNIDLAKETGTVRPELHGHFAEHLGSCIYGGLWVGKNSKIPNINGHRKQAVDYLKGLIPVCARPAAASPTIITGATASARRPSGPRTSTSTGACTPRTIATALTNSSSSAA